VAGKQAGRQAGGRAESGDSPINKKQTVARTKNERLINVTDES